MANMRVVLIGWWSFHSDGPAQAAHGEFLPMRNSCMIWPLSLAFESATNENTMRETCQMTTTARPLDEFRVCRVHDLCLSKLCAWRSSVHCRRYEDRVARSVRSLFPPPEGNIQVTVRALGLRVICRRLAMEGCTVVMADFNDVTSLPRQPARWKTSFSSGQPFSVRRR